MYDIIVDLIKHLSSSLSFLKPYATLLGVIVLLLRQNNIKKVINGRLPKRFRDTQSSDIYDIMRDIKLIKEHLGVVESNTQLNGQRTTPILSYKRFFLLLQAVMKRRKRRIYMKQYLLKLTSRRFLLAILAVIIPVVNEEFGIDLNTATIIAIIGGLVSFIIGESHVDAKKAVTENAKYQDSYQSNQ